MRNTIQGAVHKVTANALFDTAYPAVDTAEYENYHRRILLESAKRLEFHELAKRIKSDRELVKLSARVVTLITFQLSTLSNYCFCLLF